jgi:Ca2+-binding EF-hand superfamily protein
MHLTRGLKFISPSIPWMRTEVTPRLTKKDRFLFLPHLLFTMPILSPEAIEFATAIFNEADADKSGTVDMAEMKVAATKLAEYLEKPAPTDEQIAARMEAIDLDGDGVATLKEFLVFMAMIKLLLVSAEMFTVVDADGSGSIDAKELKTVMANIYTAEGLEPPSDETVAKALSELDESGDGTIDFMEFSAFVIPIILALAE